MKGMVQSVESQSKRYWISSKAIIPTVRSEQRPDKRFRIFACVVAGELKGTQLIQLHSFSHSILIRAIRLIRGQTLCFPRE
jgi:hypothetical protein